MSDETADGIQIVPISPDTVDGYHPALDVVARERRYLTMLKAPYLAATRDFVDGMV